MERDVERELDDGEGDVERIDGENPARDDTVPDELDKTIADSFPASDPPAQP